MYVICVKVFLGTRQQTSFSVHFSPAFCIPSFLLQVRMVVWGGGRSGWATPPGLAVLLLVLLWAGSVSPAPYKEDWPESWPEATDLAFPETGKSNHKNWTN
jgi:hypothetical protein